ncbi:hypothetical protein ACF1FE_30085 [Streptomyces griseofuscus]|uniref:hypothetical protein n=1 Tax=Streptomyces griseofuscus TaxID=146922 RepID=UPI0037028E3D
MSGTTGVVLLGTPGRPLGGDVGDVRDDLLLREAGPQPLQRAQVLLGLQVVAQAAGA